MPSPAFPGTFLRAASLCLVVTGTSACQRTSAAPAPATPAQAPAPEPAGERADSLDWLTVDSAAQTVTLQLKVTPSRGAPSALINGHRAGTARVIVPVGWTVRWEWQSADSTARHSLVVMVQREKVPLEGGRPSLMNAMTRAVTEGLPQGQTDQTTFVADEAGWYWMMCGVPEHGAAGEWIELRVDPEASSASVVVKKQ
jgi:plastocyanin